MNLIHPLVFGAPINLLVMVTNAVLLFGFYVVTWDEYHTHTLYLTVVSGPVEGTVLFTLFSFLSARYGSSLWATPVSEWVRGSWLPDSLCLRHLVLLGIIGPGIGAIGQSIGRVLQKRRDAPPQLVPFFLVSLCMLVCFALEPLCTDHAALFTLMYGFTFTNAVVSPPLSQRHRTLTFVC